MYTTDITTDDLDDVRAALHYPKIVLDGGSYGTMFFLDYARRHAEHVQSLVLQGVAPPGILRIPLEDAQGAAAAMRSLIADCADDAACRRRYPNFANHFAALVARMDRGPIAMEVRNAVTKRRQTVRLTKEVFADRLRQTLYSADSAAYVPYIIEEAVRANNVPLARLIEATTADLGRGLAIGLNLSVTCAEDIPFIAEAQIKSMSAHSFEGDARVRAQQAACRIWNVPPVASAFDRPVRTTAPVLMISGSADPATPPEYGRAELAFLPNGRQVVIPHAGHETESACTDALIVAFVRAGNTRSLDATKCTGDAHRPPFATSMKGFYQ